MATRTGYALAVFLVTMAFGSELPVLATSVHATQNMDLGNSLAWTNNDSTQYATVVLYRPDDQLSRKYKVHTNINGKFEVGRKEIVRLDAGTGTFQVSIDAFGHKKEAFLFTLTPGKVHYFRIQDRNNYAGARPFIEIIEVTEETFRRENL